MPENPEIESPDTTEIEQETPHPDETDVQGNCEQ
jgi:hypothetical protein